MPRGKPLQYIRLRGVIAATPAMRRTVFVCWIAEHAVTIVSVADSANLRKQRKVRCHAWRLSWEARRPVMRMIPSC